MIYCSPDGNIKQVLAERKIKFAPMESLTYAELKKVITELQPDIIHAHDMRASFVASCVCGSIPVVSHIHNNAFDSRAISLKSIAYLRAGFKAKHIFWVSQSSYDGYIFNKLFSKKSSVLCNVIDPIELYDKMRLDCNVYDYDVVYLGSIIYPKDPYRLLDVCSLLIDKCKSIKIAVVGTGAMEAEIIQNASERGLLDNISFLGFQENPYKILYNAKVMIMTSRWEGMPMCALEAMALGVPIVGTPVDGLKNIIINGQNGFLSNENEEIAHFILCILNDRELYSTLSSNQIRLSHEINNLENYKKTIEIKYKSILNQL